MYLSIYHNTNTNHINKASGQYIKKKSNAANNHVADNILDGLLIFTDFVLERFWL